MGGVCDVAYVDRTKMDVEVGEGVEYMSIGHVFITSPIGTIQSAIFDFILRGF
jgi:hypothetical protein